MFGVIGRALYPYLKVLDWGVNPDELKMLTYFTLHCPSLGALIVNIYDVESEVPRQLDNAKEVLLDPNQTIWMSNDELTKKYGRAWQKGAGELYGLPEEWPELVKRSAFFCRVLQFEEWDDNFAENPKDTQGERQFYNHWGVLLQTAKEKFKDMTIRRLSGEEHPMDPLNEYDRAFYSYFHCRGCYDNMCNIFAKRLLLPGGRIKPVGREGALWKDHFEMHGYGKEMGGFYMLSFSSTPYEIERNADLPNMIDNTGWVCLGLDTITLWSPSMEEMLKNAQSNEERVRMFTDSPEGAPGPAAIMYNGRSFSQNLPSSIRQTTYTCGNANCTKTGKKVKSHARGIQYQGVPLKKCSRCEKEWYCSSACQRMDWKRHKKVCNKT